MFIFRSDIKTRRLEEGRLGLVFSSSFSFFFT